MGKIPPNKKQENKLTWLGVTGQCSNDAHKKIRKIRWMDCPTFISIIIHENHLPVEHVQN